jgi:NAD(P)-dependent dehydrogenase (short-subunit alcohol dehydrogenase family)
MQSKAKQIALVTGANKGIGFEVARQLAASGCIVLLGARDETLGKEAAGKLAAGNLDVRFVPIDVTELSTITAAAENISRNFGRLSTFWSTTPASTIRPMVLL